jgi:hypothetical protein
MGPGGIRFMSWPGDRVGPLPSQCGGDAESTGSIRSLIAHGHRTFTLTYRIPAPVDNGSHAATVVARVGEICAFFFEEIGALPGNPADLLPPERRGELWAPASAQLLQIVS